MNLLVIIDPSGQDQSLGIEITRIMEALYWSSFENFPYVFTKETENEDHDDLRSGISSDLEAAAEQAEWKNVNYLYQIGGGSPVISHT